jgi:hypothetical protein
MGDDFRIGLGGEDMALGGQLLAQFAEILDDAVVDDGEPAARMRMGVGLGRAPMRRPAGVADAARSQQRRGRELLLEIAQLAAGAKARELALLERGDSGRVVAAIFQPLQRLDQGGRDRLASENADDAAHENVSSVEAPRCEQTSPFPLRLS